jgi:hypothetical protein
MVYCMTETNLWPSRPEDGECPTNKGGAAGLLRGGVRRAIGTVCVNLAVSAKIRTPVRYMLCESKSCTPVRWPMEEARI